MSQVTPFPESFPIRGRSGRAVLLAGLLALAVAAVLVLILALDNGSTSSQENAGAPPQPSLRSDGGPEESGVAAAVGTLPSTGPNESAIASSIAGGSTQPSSIPDESTISASVAGR